jgi:hypothetical protein
MLLFLQHRVGQRKKVRSMDNEEISVIGWYWRDLQTNLNQLRLVEVATNEEIHLSDGSFLLRILPAESGMVIRCHVRHLASGREAYLQGGANLRTFVNDCLLIGGETAGDLSPKPENLQEPSSESDSTMSSSGPGAPPETSSLDTDK